ncbi:hypothetical protein HJG60_011566 [Phyllostomus discolor]|uniref:Uncharacterized protein n=1 Tax=Phyllostomus discolor TaxID=89673 RepID=A0A834DXG4_9CHIR|nr:hypothetical protein HJG60_011566 [Phyllostomus discolor]
MGILFYLFIFKDFIYLFLEREGRAIERERNINVRLLGVMVCNPGMYPGWESNLRHFGSQPELNPLSYASQGLGMGILEQAVNKPCLRSRGRPPLHPQTANTTLKSDQGKSSGALCPGALGRTGEARPPSRSRPASSGHGEGRSGSALGAFSFLGPCPSLPSPPTLHAAPFLWPVFFFFF